jgi:pimeloyl-ACP methyl ester carboxylesterase
MPVFARARARFKRFVVVLAVLALLATLGLGVWSRRLARDAELDYPKLGRDVVVEGVALHYVERGRGRPVVMLHGAFGTLVDFTATIFDPIARTQRAIAIDRPGHGYSGRPAREACTPAVQARLVHAALSELGVERPVLVGFSYGATVALAYGLDYPAEVAAIVTLNGVTHPWPGVTNPMYWIPIVPGVGWIFTHAYVMPLGLWLAHASLEAAFAPRALPQPFHSAPVALELRPASFEANAEDMRVLKDSVRAMSERYAELAMPLVIVVGEGDKIASPLLHSHALHEQVKGSVLVSIPDAGHQVLYTDPKTVIDAIDRACEMAREREDAKASEHFERR